jgi:hypothetical protein
MQMGRHKTPRMNNQPFMDLAVFQLVNNNMFEFFSGEKIIQWTTVLVTKYNPSGS